MNEFNFIATSEYLASYAMSGLTEVSCAVIPFDGRWKWGAFGTEPGGERVGVLFISAKPPTSGDLIEFVSSNKSRITVGVQDREPIEVDL